MTGQRELNAVYLIAVDGALPRRSGPRRRCRGRADALGSLGVGRDDLAHIVVTHVHVDHAGGVGDLLDASRGRPSGSTSSAPRTSSTRRGCIASTARTYGVDRMRRFYGDDPPVRRRPRAFGRRRRSDRDRRPCARRAAHPGACLASRCAARPFERRALHRRGDRLAPALGRLLPAGHAAAGGGRRARARQHRAHARPAPERPAHVTLRRRCAIPDEGFDRGADGSSSWSATVRAALEDDPVADGDQLESVLREQAREEYEADSGSSFDLGRYDAIGSIRMNADGLARYWRKRWEREAAALS